MFTPSPATRVYLAVGATDLRKSFDGLAGLARERLSGDPLSGHLFVFCNRARTRIKVLFFDGSGLWVCAKRLEQGCFSWPSAKSVDGAAGQSCDAAELMLVLGGIDPKETRQKRWWRAPQAQENSLLANKKSCQEDARKDSVCD